MGQSMRHEIIALMTFKSKKRHLLTLCYAFLLSADFFKVPVNFFEKFFQEYFVGPDLAPNSVILFWILGSYLFLKICENIS